MCSLRDTGFVNKVSSCKAWVRNKTSWESLCGKQTHMNVCLLAPQKCFPVYVASNSKFQPVKVQRLIKLEFLFLTEQKLTLLWEPSVKLLRPTICATVNKQTPHLHLQPWLLLCLQAQWSYNLYKQHILCKGILC